MDDEKFLQEILPFTNISRISIQASRGRRDRIPKHGYQKGSI